MTNKLKVSLLQHDLFCKLSKENSKSYTRCVMIINVFQTEERILVTDKRLENNSSHIGLLRVDFSWKISPLRKSPHFPGETPPLENSFMETSA